MQFNITPIKAKITDSNLSNVLTVRIGGDDGITSCSVQYNIGYQATAVTGQATPSVEQSVNGNYRLTGTDYTNYAAANTSNAAKMLFAAQYVATKLSLTLGTPTGS